MSDAASRWPIGARAGNLDATIQVSFKDTIDHRSSGRAQDEPNTCALSSPPVQSGYIHQTAIRAPQSTILSRNFATSQLLPSHLYGRGRTIPFNTVATTETQQSARIVGVASSWWGENTTQSNTGLKDKRGNIWLTSPVRFPPPLHVTHWIMLASLAHFF